MLVKKKPVAAYLSEEKKFKKGNPGRPKGSVNKNKLEKAIAKVEKKKGKKFLEHFVEKAFVDEKTMHKLIDKLEPDKKEFDGKIGIDGDLKVSFAGGARLR